MSSDAASGSTSMLRRHAASSRVSLASIEPSVRTPPGRRRCRSRYRSLRRAHSEGGWRQYVGRVQRAGAALSGGWICLVAVSLGVLGFGAGVALAPPAGDELLYRADGLASIGVGLFGGLLALVPFRRRERWAWFALWFYPVFWVAHLVGQLPPGKDHIHQVVFLALSLLGLLVPAREFFRGADARG
ncbi:hypothetical protein ABZU76_38040 [Amycolatopsis sp. NPDC005232]|uniref:hypothetical protein n=1 Tax=Amycolatopsis sp. NPDC005232 TaxID=3157027 RepID=UPI0033AAA717